MTTDTPQDRQLEDWSATFRAALERVHALTDDLSPQQLNFKPAPDRWSVGQCLDHVSVSMGIYLDPMEPTIERAEPRALRSGGGGGGGGDDGFGRGTFMGRLLVGALRKPGGRYKAPRRFRPASSDLDADAVRREFERQTTRMQEALARSEGLALGRVKMPWPVFGLIKITLAQAFELQALHTDRHLDQAERVTRSERFPD